MSCHFLLVPRQKKIHLIFVSHTITPTFMDRLRYFFVERGYFGSGPEIGHIYMYLHISHL